MVLLCFVVIWDNAVVNPFAVRDAKVFIFNWKNKSTSFIVNVVRCFVRSVDIKYEWISLPHIPKQETLVHVEVLSFVPINVPKIWIHLNCVFPSIKNALLFLFLHAPYLHQQSLC